MLLITFPLLALSASYLYEQYLMTKKDVLDIVHTNVFEKKSEDLDIYVSFLKKEFGEDFIQALKSSESKRQKAEGTLRLMKSSEVKYLYLLYVDEKGRLRYLLDTTEDIDERGEFKQRFIPQKRIWEEAQKQTRTAIAAQQDIDKLWVSMAYPVVVKAQTVALLGIDFSHEEDVKINQILVPLDKMYFYSAVFIIVMFISAFIQFLIYYLHRKKSFIDPLTGMYNRQYLNELLKSYSVEKFHILIMDLDHFKQVNDVYGHDAGDMVLQTVSKRIQSVIRKKDILIRYGGEEFLLLIAGADKEASTALAQRIRKKVKAHPIAIESCSLDATMSIGLNPFPERSENFSQAVKIADECLYRAKHFGRDRVEVYDALSSGFKVNTLKSSEVKEALDEGRIFGVYQAIEDMQTSKPMAYELLIRIHDEDKRVIEPSKFLPFLKNTKLYTQLSKRVLDIGIRTLKEKREITLSINMDLRDLFSDELFELFVKHFSPDRSLAERLILEVSEQEEMLESELASERLLRLKEMGVKLAIDNFGIGYANYKYLLKMDIDYLKIDGSLIRNIDSDEDSKRVVASINTLAQELGMITIGEHIQTQAELQTLKEMGINYGQGYYLCEPKADLP